MSDVSDRIVDELYDNYNKLYKLDVERGQEDYDSLWYCYKKLVAEVENIQSVLEKNKLDWILHKNKKDRELFLNYSSTNSI